jgi:16S rRNA (guanine527-N7)-methyltransferase
VRRATGRGQAGGRKEPPGAIEPGWLGTRLAEPAERAGVALAPQALESLARYTTLLLAWRRRINLTAATDAAIFADQHLADALFLVPHLPVAARLVDVGSGAGLPGLVVGLVRPDLRVTLLEPARKRYAFLRAALRALDAPNLRVRAESLEDHRSAPAFSPYDAAVSRATWPLAEWLERGRALVREGGSVLGLEGRRLARLPRDAVRSPYTLGGEPRAVVSVFHVEDAPAPSP